MRPSMVTLYLVGTGQRRSLDMLPLHNRKCSVFDAPDGFTLVVNHSRQTIELLPKRGMLCAHRSIGPEQVNS